MASIEKSLQNLQQVLQNAHAASWALILTALDEINAILAQGER